MIDLIAVVFSLIFGISMYRFFFLKEVYRENSDLKDYNNILCRENTELRKDILKCEKNMFELRMKSPTEKDLDKALLYWQTKYAAREGDIIAKLKQESILNSGVWL